jgi:hypothetical protein
MGRAERIVERSGVCRWAAPAILGAALVGAGGCQDPLLSPNEPRSQYDRYDQIRNERVQQSVIDEYGQKKPNLRGRLLK